jgi:hypothetical protein
MNDLQSGQLEAAEDLFFGQIVIIWARWFLVLTGIILFFLTTTEETELARAVLPIVSLMAMNFFLHGRYLMERPANRALILIASLLDLTIITYTILFWPGQSGLQSLFFVFYYPVVFSFAFVFPWQYSIAYTALVFLAYTGASFYADRTFLAAVLDQQILVERLITIGAMGGLGTYYWRIQRDRRRAAAQQHSP